MAGEINPKGILLDSDLERMCQSASLTHKEAEICVARSLQEWQDACVGTRIRDLLDTAGCAYGRSVGRMLALLEAASRRIPVPRGFFTEKEDRHTAVIEACHLLTQMEAEVQSLREQISFYGGLLAPLQEALVKEMQTEAEWMLLRSVDPNAAAPLPLGTLREERLCVEKLMGEIPVFCRGVSDFCQGTWSGFCMECSDRADIPHNGENGQIGALLQVLSSFRGAIDRLPKAPAWNQ